MLKLRYIGDGSGLSGFPARDLSSADLSRLARDPFIRRRYAKHASALARVLCEVRVNGVPLYAPAARPAADESPSADGKE